MVGDLNNFGNFEGLKAMIIHCRLVLGYNGFQSLFYNNHASSKILFVVRVCAVGHNL